MLRAVLLPAAAPALAAEPFSYAGIGLDATAASLKPVFPNLEVRRRLRASRGQPVATEPLPRSDRVWKGARESMTLVCFAGPDGELLAEAVVIAEK